MSIIEQVVAREILDSRGQPTVEVDVELSSGARGRAAVPSGASTGAHEALELRDGGDRYGGKGVLTAVANVNGEIADAVTGPAGRCAARHRRADDRARRHGRQVPPRRQRHPRACRWRWPGRRPTTSTWRCYRYLGGVNASVLPVPMMNVLNGGAHADSNVDLQEFMIVPVGAASFSEGLRWGSETYQALKRSAEGAGAGHRAGRRGRLRPQPGVQRGGPGQLLVEAIGQAGYTPGEEIALALDVASTEFYADGVYNLAGEGKTYSVGGVRRLPGRAVRPLPDRLHRRRHGRRRLGRAGGS